MPKEQNTFEKPITLASLVELANRPKQPPSEQRLNEIEERCRKATSGGWIVARESDVWGTIGGPVCYMDEDNAIVVGQPGDWGPTNDPVDDAEFIAHARQDVPDLLAEVRRLRSLIDLNCEPGGLN